MLAAVEGAEIPHLLAQLSLRFIMHATTGTEMDQRGSTHRNVKESVNVVD